MVKTKSFVHLCLVIILFVVLSAHQSYPATVSFVDAGSVMIDVEIADTEVERAMGLMFRSSIPDDKGMWFIFEKIAPQTFWMKNVSFPIDILFIDKDYVIRKIWNSVPPCMSDPCEFYQSGVEIKYTLETAAGFCEANGVEENQRVIFKQ